MGTLAARIRQAHRQFQAASLGEACQQRGIKAEIRRVNVVVRPGRDPIDAQRQRMHDRRSALDAQRDVDEIALRSVRDHKLPDDRDRILVIG
ncbi:hypothetical protein ACRBEV_25485 [Methylobacterium phyllosphaerae]